jgi:hypothetical protein
VDSTSRKDFAWINGNRRISKEFDLLATSENFIYLAMNKAILKEEMCIIVTFANNL